MIVIEFDKWGRAVSDFELDQFASHIEDIAYGHKLFRQQHKRDIGEAVTFSVSTSLAIHVIRASICEGKIEPEDVAFRFEGKDLHVDENGRMDTWPFGFCDAFDIVLEKLLEPRKKKAQDDLHPLR